MEDDDEDVVDASELSVVENNREDGVFAKAAEEEEGTKPLAAAGARINIQDTAKVLLGDKDDCFFFFLFGQVATDVGGAAADCGTSS